MIPAIGAIGSTCILIGAILREVNWKKVRLYFKGSFAVRLHPDNEAFNH